MKRCKLWKKMKGEGELLDPDQIHLILVMAPVLRSGGTETESPFCSFPCFLSATLHLGETAKVNKKIMV